MIKNRPGEKNGGFKKEKLDLKPYLVSLEILNTLPIRKKDIKVTQTKMVQKIIVTKRILFKIYL